MAIRPSKGAGGAKPLKTTKPATSSSAASGAGKTDKPKSSGIAGEAGGAALDRQDEVRAKMEKAFGADFSGVEAHTGSKAKEADESTGAEAYASGDRIAFAEDEPDLHTAAHEAAHVVQQGGSKATDEEPKAES